MTTPNPATIFGRRRSPVTPESPTTPTEVVVIPAEPEVTATEDTKARVINRDLGNGELPIAAFREQIVDAVDSSQATVITAETGAGKSTQVPQFLAKQGYEVIVTQPRVVAARSVAERVQDEIVSKRGQDYKDFVGYRTARERGDNKDNQILFVTDGLQLVRELSGNGVDKKQVLVLDEVHEWNENMEVLVAWSKQRMAEDPNFKVVTMSATMEAYKLSKYFAGDAEREVPVIKVPGRTFEVKKSEGSDVGDEAIKMANAGKNTLVFVPGKAEIDQVIGELERARVPGATILPLHGQMEKEDQRKVFKKYPGVKVIVATNVAQTSITIDDIDAVVDSGLERQNQVKNGVEGLYLNPISQADCLQRAGRAGRTKEGEYVLAQLGNNPFVGMADRDPYGTPEIMRTRLDGMVLRLAKSGFDAAAMEFYHQPEHGEIAKAKERLQKLGALNEYGGVTKIGRDMDRMPVESHYARMMIEARNYSPEVQMQLAALLAVQEVGGICQFATKNRPCDERWYGLLTPGMNDSDLIKQLEVFVAAQTMSDRQKRDHDIYVKAFGKAREVLRQLRGVEKLKDQNLTMPSAEQREQLVKCVISGMVDNLYINEGYYGHRNAQGSAREISSRSMVRPTKMVVGKPFDLQVNGRRGMTTLQLLESPTNVPSVELLIEVAPQLFSEKHYGYALSADGEVIEQLHAMFNGQNTGEMIERLAAESEARRDYLVQVTANQYWQSPDVKQTMRVVEDLNNRVPGSVSVMALEQVKEVMRAAMPLGVATLAEAQEYVPQFSLDDLVSAAEREAIMVTSPDEFNDKTIIYKDGIPMIAYGMTDDEIMSIVAEDMILPDGREIMIAGYGYYISSVSIIDKQESITQNRVRQAEQAQKEHEQKITNALYRFGQGMYTYEAIAQAYGEQATTQAYELYKAELAEQAAAEAAAEELRKAKAAAEAERRDAVIEQIDKLRSSNSDLYDRTRLAGLEDAPQDIQDTIADIQAELDDMDREVAYDQDRVGWGHEVALDTYSEQLAWLNSRVLAVVKQFNDWCEAEEQRANRPASQDDLAALVAKFNKR